MGYVYARWLADEFRAAGLKVVEVEGWENRGRPASVGHFEPNGANTVHHTGTLTSAERRAPTLETCIKGRPDLPGPLCQWLTAYDGTIFVIAAGRANHAGPIGRSGVPGMPYGGDGNRYALGDEVDTNGTQPLPPAQRDAMALAARVVNDHYDRDEQWTHRHADISSSGKWDIGQLTTTQVRALVRAATTQEDDMASEEVQQQLDRIEATGKQVLQEQRAERKARSATLTGMVDRQKRIATAVRKRSTTEQVEDLAAELEQMAGQLAALVEQTEQVGATS